MAAFPPAREEPPKKSRNVAEAIAKLGEQATLLTAEAKGEIPLHDTLYEIVDRMI